jgi:hypothetical protein
MKSWYSPWYLHGIPMFSRLESPNKHRCSAAQEELWTSQRLLGRSVEIRRDDPRTWTKDVAQCPWNWGDEAFNRDFTVLYHEIRDFINHVVI